MVSKSIFLLSAALMSLTVAASDTSDDNSIEQIGDIPVDVEEVEAYSDEDVHEKRSPEPEAEPAEAEVEEAQVDDDSLTTEESEEADTLEANEEEETSEPATAEAAEWEEIDEGEIEKRSEEGEEEQEDNDSEYNQEVEDCMAKCADAVYMSDSAEESYCNASDPESFYSVAQECLKCVCKVWPILEDKDLFIKGLEKCNIAVPNCRPEEALVKASN